MSEVLIYFSAANFGVRVLRTSPEQIGEFAAEAGYDAVEVVPFRDRPDAIVRAVETGSLAVGSLHQGFRASRIERNACALVGEVGLNFTDRVMRLPLVGSQIVRPDMLGSADFMSRIQKGIGRQLPGTFYPQEYSAHDKRILDQAHTSEKLFQPTDHVAYLVGAPTVDAMKINTKERGYTGYVLDTFHVRQQYPYAERTVSTERAIFETIAPAAIGAHLSLGRFEFEATQPTIPTRQELVDALNGKFRGQLAEMLRVLANNEHLQYVVVELVQSSIAQVMKGRQTRADMVQAYKDIASLLRDSLNTDVVG